MIYKLKELGVNQVSITYIRLLIFNLTELKILRNTKWQLRDCEVIWIVNYASTYYVYATTCMQLFFLYKFFTKFTFR